MYTNWNGEELPIKSVKWIDLDGDVFDEKVISQKYAKLSDITIDDVEMMGYYGQLLDVRC